MTRDDFINQINKIGCTGADRYRQLLAQTIADYIDSKLPPAIPPVKPKKLNKPLTYDELHNQNDRLVQSNSDLIAENQRLATENGTLKIKLQAISRALAAN